MSSHDQPRCLLDNQNATSDYTLRKMYGFYQGQVYKMFSRLPLYKTQLKPEQIMRYKTMMDSMTDRELDGLKPEQMSAARMMEIARGSRQDVKQVSEMLEDFTRLEKVWRNVQKLMSDTKMMEMSALFWNEIATPFNIEIVPEAENIPPQNEKPRSCEYSLRKMYGLYQGQVYKMFSRLPLYKTQQIMRYKTIMDSMTDIELDGPNPEQVSGVRIMEIVRESGQGLKVVSEMMKEFKRLEKVWRDVEKLMSQTKLMDKSALFWNEMATPTFNIEIVPETEMLLPHKLELKDWVKWALIYFGTFVFCFVLGMSFP